MNPSATSHYNHLVQAAQAVRKELGYFTDNSDEDVDENLDVEMRFLKASLDYYDGKGLYPFGTSVAVKDFCKNWFVMNPDDFYEENQKLRKKYKKRVRKICKKFELLEPREQEAFELGSKIWGSRSGGKELATSNFCASFLPKKKRRSGIMREDEVRKEDVDILARFRFLKETFQFGSSNLSNAVMMPVLPEGEVKAGLAALGSPKMKQWDDNWKKILIKETKIFLERFNLIREQTMSLLTTLE